MCPCPALLPKQDRALEIEANDRAGRWKLVLVLLQPAISFATAGFDILVLNQNKIESFPYFEHFDDKDSNRSAWLLEIDEKAETRWFGCLCFIDGKLCLPGLCSQTQILTHRSTGNTHLRNKHQLHYDFTSAEIHSPIPHSFSSSSLSSEQSNTLN